MGVGLGRVVVTGAAGRIGSAVRARLRDEDREIVLVDRVEQTAVAPTERVVRLDLTDLDAVVAALEGADAVVHLAGIPDEAPFDDVVAANLVTTQRVLEAARRQLVRRVVLASSNRVTGLYAVGQPVTTDAPVRPDGFYAVSKAAVEALGRMYVEKFGLSVVRLRIGSFEDRPAEPRHLATWLSPRDCVGFVRAALTAPDLGFVTAYAVSANTRRFWDTAGWTQLGYRPVDDAECHADHVPGAAGPVDPAAPQSGSFASAEYTLTRGGLS